MYERVLKLNGKKINFMIIGFPKSGTTSVYKWMENHPDICMCYPKELGFFWEKYSEKKLKEEFKKSFKHYDGEKYIGTADTSDVVSEMSLKRIKRYNPDAKILIFTRNKEELLIALKNELYFWGTENPEDFWVYKKIEMNSLKKFVKKWRSNFEDNLIVFDLEDLRKDSEEVYKKILKFLEIPYFHQDLKTYNKRKEIRFEFIRRMFIIFKKFPKPLKKFFKTVIPLKARIKILEFNNKAKKPD